MSAVSTARHVFLLTKRACLLVGQEDMPSFSTTRPAFLMNKKTRLLVEHEGMSSRGARRHVLLFKKTCLQLLNKKTCLLAHMGTEWVVLQKNQPFGSHAGVICANFVVYVEYCAESYADC